MTTLANKIILPEFSGLKTGPIEESNYTEMLAVCVVARNNAKHRGDFIGAGHASRGMAECYRRLGRLSDAEAEYEIALNIFSEFEDQSGSAWTMWALANLRRQQGNFRSAIWLLRAACKASPGLRDLRLAAYATAGLAETVRILGDYPQAEKLHDQALSMFRRMEDIRGVIWALEGTAQMMRLQGRHHEALDNFSSALKLAAASNDQRGLAYAFKCRAETLSNLRHHASALHDIQIAICMFRNLGYSQGLAYAWLAQGDIFRTVKDETGSFAAYQNALKIFESLHDPRGIAYSQLSLASCYSSASFHDRAEFILRQAHSYFVKAGIRIGLERCSYIGKNLVDRFGYTNNILRFS